MKKKHVFSKKRGKNKKRGNMDTKKVILIIIILALAVFVFTLIKPKEDEINIITPPISGEKRVYQSCEEGCSGNNECLNGCFIATINRAVLDADLDLCNTIDHDESKQLCLDKVNLKLAIQSKDLSKCELIKDTRLKNTCLENAK